MVVICEQKSQITVWSVHSFQSGEQQKAHHTIHVDSCLHEHQCPFQAIDRTVSQSLERSKEVMSVHLSHHLTIDSVATTMALIVTTCQKLHCSLCSALSRCQIPKLVR